MEAAPDLGANQRFTAPSVFYARDDVMEAPCVWVMEAAPSVWVMEAAPSVFYARDDVVEENPTLKGHTYSFEGGYTWIDFGTQGVLATSCRPDCFQAEPGYFFRLPPPRQRRESPIIIDPPATNPRPTYQEIFACEANPSTLRNAITVEVNKRVLYAIASAHTPSGSVRADCRYFGRRPSNGYPMCLREYAGGHALDLAAEYNTDCRGARLNAAYSVLLEGGPRLCGLLSAWFGTGAWRLQSEAGGMITRLLRQLAERLRLRTPWWAS